MSNGYLNTDCGRESGLFLFYDATHNELGFPPRNFGAEEVSIENTSLENDLAQDLSSKEIGEETRIDDGFQDHQDAEINDNNQNDSIGVESNEDDYSNDTNSNDEYDSIDAESIDEDGSNDAEKNDSARYQPIF